FAAETTDVLANAKRKLHGKNVDLLVLNDVSAPGVGFEHDTNEVTILGVDDFEMRVGLTDKRTVADAVLNQALRVHRTQSGDVGR
ncbi:MAG: bifunctional phosphopantothenoylcysteine decarboxylase/phosphopantothenate--cysteine ligase CoaBC, partial [Microthrixaceae bacterium]|nr:bifunctional phosphopantothenoylcysteine decarboxylase/phosphopantothenate--cysteine ligase CoaBC [Microthrixaceae bacterium]